MFGAHFFHRWMGGWGTLPAFSQSYRGGEPTPGPHAPVTAAPVITAAVDAAPVAIPEGLAVPVLPIAAADLRPRGKATPTPLLGEYAGSGEVLDRWRDTGKPLK